MKPKIWIFWGFGVKMDKMARKHRKFEQNSRKKREKGARVPEAIATGGFSKKGYALV
ncbi:MAG: hypothetical protein GX803_02475 [Lentisphaerae bacterium]|jgi:hypothetical protein|nr:hypothetical protein [Lentisphaerota bacterium]